MFHRRFEIGKERMLDGLFQKVSRVDFFSICSNLVEKRSERMVVVLLFFSKFSKQCIKQRFIQDHLLFLTALHCRLRKKQKILPGISVTRWIGMWCCSFSATAQMPERSSKAEGRGFNLRIERQNTAPAKKCL